MLGCKAGKRPALPAPIARDALACGHAEHAFRRRRIFAVPAPCRAPRSPSSRHAGSSHGDFERAELRSHVQMGPAQSLARRRPASGTDRVSMRSQGKAWQRSMHVRVTRVQHPESRLTMQRPLADVRRPPRHFGLPAAIDSHQAETPLQSLCNLCAISGACAVASRDALPASIAGEGWTTERSLANSPGAALRAGWRRRIRCAGALAVAAVARPRPRTARWRQGSKWGRARSRRRRRHR
jgi:hypothetical protein